MTRTARLLSLAGALALLCNCGGGGGAPGDQGLPGPTDLKAVPYWDTNWTQGQLGVRLGWIPPAKTLDSVDVEWKYGANAYQAIVPSEAYVSYIPTVPVLPTVNGFAPEMTNYWFRIRGFEGGKATDYSNEASFYWGLHPPSLITFKVSTGDAQLNWANKSRVADTLVLGRQTGSAPTDYGTFTPIPGVGLGTTSYFDNNLPEGTWVQYRLTVGKDTVTANTDTGWQQVYLSPPADLQASIVGKDITLAWTNRSARATSTTVNRAPGPQSASSTALATLGAGATAYADPGVPYGFYEYTLTVTEAASGHSATSRPIHCLHLPTDGTLAFNGTLVPMAPFAVGRMDNQGRWGFDREQWVANQYQPTLCAPAGAAWTDHVLDQAALTAMPMFQFDRQGHPHAVYFQPGPDPLSKQVKIYHAWHDGASWKLELIAEPYLENDLMGVPPPSVSLALGASGQAYVFWGKSRQYLNGAFTDFPSQLATRAGDGTWTLEGLDSIDTSDTYWQNRQVFTGPDGEPSLLMSGITKIRHAHRAAQGGWVTEDLPLDPTLIYAEACLAAGATSDGSTWVLFDLAPSSASAGRVLVAMRKAGGTWGQPVLLSSVGDTYTVSTNRTLQVSPDGQRLAFTYDDPSGRSLVTLTNGTWGYNLIGPVGAPPPGLGFDPLGKLHLLQPWNVGGWSTVDTYVQLDEQ